MELDAILDASAEALAAELARVEAQLAALSAESAERVRWVALELADRAAASACASPSAAAPLSPPAAPPVAAAPALAPPVAQPADAVAVVASAAAAEDSAGSGAGAGAGGADSAEAAPPTAAEAAEAAARRRAAVAQLARQRFQAERGVARRAAAALAGRPLPPAPPPERRASAQPDALPPKPPAKPAKPATPQPRGAAPSSSAAQQPVAPPAAVSSLATPPEPSRSSALDAPALRPPLAPPPDALPAAPPATSSPRSRPSSALRRSSDGVAATDPQAAQAAEAWMSRQWARMSVSRPAGGDDADADAPQPAAAPEAALLLAQAVPPAGGAPEPAEGADAVVALFAYAARDDGDDRRSDGGGSSDASGSDADDVADAAADAHAFPDAPSDADADALEASDVPTDSELEAAPASYDPEAGAEPSESPLTEVAALSDEEEPARADDDDDGDAGAATDGSEEPASPVAVAAVAAATPPRATPPAGGVRTPGRRAQTASGPGKRGARGASAAVVGTDYGALYSCFEEIFTAFARAPSAPPAPRRADGRAVADLYRLTAAAADAWCAARGDDGADHASSPRAAAAAAAMRAFWPSAPAAAGGADKAAAATASRRTRYYRCPCEAHAEVTSIVARALEDADAVGEWRLEESGSQPADNTGLGGLYNLLWTWSSAHRPSRPGELLTWQRSNHFAGIKALTRKDLLARHLERARRTRGAAFDLCPRTFQLPSEYVAFVDAFTRAAEEAEGGRAPLWIMKPVGLSRGRGIFLVSDLGDVAYGEAHVVQRYIEKPLLVDGHKFDLRLYVLVTSFAPVEAFLYAEGFARFSSERYSLADARNLRVHLTNYAVQKVGLAAGAQVAPPAPLAGLSAAAAGGSKCSLAHLWGVLRARRVDVGALWARIGDVVRRSLFAVHDVIPHQPNAFELLGYDIMVDAALKPWLIEVNSSPSLETDHPVDVSIKTRLVRDVAALLDPPAFDRAALAAVLRRRAAGGRAAPRGSDGAMGMGTLAEERSALNADLNAILGGALPRRTGEPPAAPGLFARIAPSPEWDALLAKAGKDSGGGGPAKSQGGRPPRGS